MPGVPDFYQGTELWDLSLVDPDNRRPIDFSARQQILANIPGGWSRLADNWRDGHVKLALTQRLLRLRGQYADVYAHGSYEPLTVSGPHAEHVIAFTRSFRRQQIVVIGLQAFSSASPLTNCGKKPPVDIDATVNLDLQLKFEDALASGAGPRLVNTSVQTLFADIPVCVLQKV